MKKIITIFIIPALFIMLFSQTASAQTWQTVGTVGFSAGVATFTSIACSSTGTPYVVYEDAGNGTKATVLKFNGTSWVAVGTAGFSAGQVYYTGIAFNSSDVPYVVYADVASGSRATVMKFNGTSWVLVGAQGFSAGQIMYSCIAIDGSGTPYVVYQDVATSNKATVKKFNGSSWITVGAVGFSAGAVSNTTIAIDLNGTPYVTYQDLANNQKATVMKFDGTNWVNVGIPGFSPTAAYTSIACDGSGTPYVTYKDYATPFKASVMKFDGSNWVQVGVQGFTGNQADYTAIVFDKSGFPNVVFEDYYASRKATVMKYDGTNWVNVGNAGFSAGQVYYPALAFDNAGNAYCVYQDWQSLKYATVKKFANPCVSPSISSQSTSTQTQCAGGTFTPITVTATGTNIIYDWYKNTIASNSGGTPLGIANGASTNSYTTQSNTVGTLYYYCVVTGSCGTVTSNVSGAFITNPGTEITSQVTAAQTQCIDGAFMPITVFATGTNLSYQWYSNTVASNSGGISLSADNGAQTYSYTPQATIAGTKYYYCVVSGSCGTSTSLVSGAFITNPSTAITTQSTAAQTRCIGGTFAPITVTASGTNLTYQWYVNTLPANTGGTSLGAGNGAQTNSYTPQSNNIGTLFYYCMVSGNCGTNQVSNVSGAFVTNPATLITEQSTASQTQCLQGTFNPITITANGTNVTYQWYKNTIPNNTGGVLLGADNGAQTNSYTPQASTVGTLYYYCIASGDCGTTQKSDVSGAFVVNPCYRYLILKLFLQGLYFGNGMMNQAKSVSGNAFENGVADTLKVELHNTSSPNDLAYSFDATNLFADGSDTVKSIPVYVTGSYYIVIRHRNSIETWSNDFVPIYGDGPFRYDFTTAASKAYANNMKLMPGNVFAIFAGDARRDGLIDGGDMSAIDNATIAIRLGYNQEDVNGDGLVDGSDMAIIDNNSVAVVFYKRPY